MTDFYLMRLRQVMAATGLSRSAIYRIEAEGKFPPRVRITERTSGWRSDLVQGWIESRPLARDTQAA